MGEVVREVVVVYMVEGRMSHRQNARAGADEMQGRAGEAVDVGDAYNGRTEFGCEGADAELIRVILQLIERERE